MCLRLCQSPRRRASLRRGPPGPGRNRARTRLAENHHLQRAMLPPHVAQRRCHNLLRRTVPGSPLRQQLVCQRSGPCSREACDRQRRPMLCGAREWLRFGCAGGPLHVCLPTGLILCGSWRALAGQLALGGRIYRRACTPSLLSSRRIGGRILLGSVHQWLPCGAPYRAWLTFPKRPSALGIANASRRR